VWGIVTRTNLDPLSRWVALCAGLLTVLFIVLFTSTCYLFKSITDDVF
jgi:hypothetical protein